MNQINKKNINSFFFFVDCIKEFESKYFKVDNFFNDTSVLHPNKYFSVFSNSKVDFDFLEKNEKLLSFFYVFNTFFFKNQIKNLKIFLLNEIQFKIAQKKHNFCFFFNFFFFRHLYCFVFLLKKLSFIKNKIK